MKRLANIADALMPDTPTVEVFLGVLRKVREAPVATVDALLGSIGPPEDDPKPLTSHYKSALNAFFEYMSVCEAHRVNHSSLEDCFLGWTKWSVDAYELYADKAKALVWIAARKEKAGTQFRI